MTATAHADYVVVGSGVAGSLIAHQLAMAGKDVLILEAGPRISRWNVVERFRHQADKFDFQAPYPSAPHAPHPEYHPDNRYLIQKGEHPYQTQFLRVVGGTTWHWAGAAWRFLPNDFRLKSLYGVGRDWPIDYTELEPWYQRAEEALGVWGAPDEDLGSPRKKPYPMTPLPLSWNDERVKSALNANGFRMVTEPAARNSSVYDERPPCCGSNNCMPICPIGAMYNGITHVDKAERAGARLIENAVVYKLETGKGNRISAVHYKTPRNEEVRVVANTFVLAANGIETPKLMLMSDVGNSSDMVGRNLMDHPSTFVQFYAKEKLWPGRGPQGMTSIVDFRDGSFRSEYASKKIHLFNVSPVDIVTEQLVANAPLRPNGELDKTIRDRTSRFVMFGSFHEILPQPRNRIMPSSNERDALGIPKPEIAYAIDDYVRKSAAHTRSTYARMAQLLDGSEVNFDDSFGNSNHITGTTLMGDDPKDSVVDKDCRAHDHPNLFIAGGSVMPTVGSVNCTLTIAALALRLSNQLKRGA
ncbi:GMC family oxidoreductase [Burkholderia multivorans]|uniref:GMC family oxidoreductase n=1 Tax=Burkholderia multivorans TaxID=87883 RepID=UPI0021C19E27|nr:GMC family oxidoreductase [Burkholderia multivorans]